MMNSNMKPPAVKLDARAHALIVGDRKVVLQRKAFELVMLLKDRTGIVVTRDEIIDQLWGDNHWTGDKGLNQAVWSIRSALRDDPANPNYIRTVPRVGYEWIATGGSVTLSSVHRQAALAAGALLGLAAFAALILSTGQSAQSEPQKAIAASLSGNQIEIKMDTGCVGFIKSSLEKRLGEPVLSSDGLFVLFPETTAAGCKMVSIELRNGTRQEFPGCGVG